MLTQPAPLKKGDSVALVAPSSPVTKAVLAASVRSIKLLGLKPVVMPGCSLSKGYLAGPDAQRAEDLNDAFSNPSVQGIFCIRGGYGSARILPLLDLKSICRNPKVFTGYSDITALHTTFNRLCGFATFHGPMPGEDYTCLNAYSLESLKKALFSSDFTGEFKNPPGEALNTLFPGQAEGILTGGNLTVLQSTLGSAYEIDTKGKILFLEDTGESPYRLDRALTALALAGKFRDCKGIVLGAFTNCGESCAGSGTASAHSSKKGDFRLREIFQELLIPWRKPVVFNLHAGHIASQCTLPFGMRVSLDAGIQKASLFW